MKKIIAIMLCVALFLLMAGCGLQKHRGFSLDGDNYSVIVTDGEIELYLIKNTKSDIWACKDESDLFTIDAYEERDDSVKLHITSLKGGSDTIDIKHVSADGTEETYNLTIKISGQIKMNLLVDSVTFVKAD